MRKLLLTGFEPFGGEPINPAVEAVRRLQTSPLLSSTSRKIRAPSLKPYVKAAEACMDSDSERLSRRSSKASKSSGLSFFFQFSIAAEIFRFNGRYSGSLETIVSTGKILPSKSSSKMGFKRIILSILIGSSLKDNTAHGRIFMQFVLSGDCTGEVAWFFCESCRFLLFLELIMNLPNASANNIGTSRFQCIAAFI